ncbi:MAG: hypothetical protein PUB98_08115 [Clostridiales bacterium]|nr:hypothetical protein [Clostridiales bacterium]
MEYTIIMNGQSYDLPKKTIAVMEKLDEVLKVDSTNLNVRKKFEKLHEFVKGTVGDDAAKEILGSDIIAEIDLSDLTLAVKRIADAYDEPIRNYNEEKASRALSAIPIDKIISMTKAAEKMASVPQNR